MRIWDNENVPATNWKNYTLKPRIMKMWLQSLDLDKNYHINNSDVVEKPRGRKRWILKEPLKKVLLMS